MTTKKFHLLGEAFEGEGQLPWLRKAVWAGYLIDLPANFPSRLTVEPVKLVLDTNSLAEEDLLLLDVYPCSQIHLLPPGDKPEGLLRLVRRLRRNGCQVGLLSALQDQDLPTLPAAGPLEVRLTVGAHLDLTNGEPLRCNPDTHIPLAIPDLLYLCRTWLTQRGIPPGQARWAYNQAPDPILLAMYAGELTVLIYRDPAKAPSYLKLTTRSPQERDTWELVPMSSLRPTISQFNGRRLRLDEDLEPLLAQWVALQRNCAEPPAAPDRPVQLVGGKGLLVNMPSACRHQCQFCSYEPTPSRPALTVQRLAEALEALPAADLAQVEKVTLTGNDPLEVPEFEDLLEYLSERFPQIVVQTPGDWLREHRYSTRFCGNPKLSLVLPLYSADQAEHEAVMRGAGSHAVVLELLADPEFAVSVQCLVLRTNIGALRGVWELAREHRRGLTFRLLAPGYERLGQGGRYAENVPSQTAVLQAVGEVLTEPIERREFLAFNAGLLLPCIVGKVWGEEWQALLLRRSRGARGANKCPHAGECALTEHCPGPHPAYLAVHGEGELEAVEAE